MHLSRTTKAFDISYDSLKFWKLCDLWFYTEKKESFQM